MMKSLLAGALVLLWGGHALANGSERYGPLTTHPSPAPKYAPAPAHPIVDAAPNPCPGKEHCGMVCRQIIHPNYKGGPWSVYIQPCPTCKPVSTVAVPANTPFTYACAKVGMRACVEYRTDAGVLMHRWWNFGPVTGHEVSEATQPKYRVSTMVIAPPVKRHHRPTYRRTNSPDRNWAGAAAWVRNSIRSQERR